MSQEPSSRRLCKAFLLPPRRSVAMGAVSSGMRRGRLGMDTGVSLLVSSTWGGRPGERIRSLTPLAKLSMVEMTTGVGTTGRAGAAETAGDGAAAAATCGLVAAEAEDTGS